MFAILALPIAEVIVVGSLLGVVLIHRSNT